MSLPKLEVPTYTMELPSTKQKIKYRPFLIKEEKILTIALQDGDDETIIQALKDICDYCTFKKLNIDDLTCFDFEYLFINIRSKSKGSVVDLQFKCQNEVDGKPCGHVNKFSIDLDNVVVKSKYADHSTKIMISDTIGLQMRYPKLDDVLDIKRIVDAKDQIKMFQKVKDYIVCVFEGDKVYDDFTLEEFDTFIESMNEEQYEKILKFLSGIPTVMLDFEIKCDKCGYSEKVTLEGLKSFLA
jgi:hypothetical protein